MSETTSGSQFAPQPELPSLVPMSLRERVVRFGAGTLLASAVATMGANLVDGDGTAPGLRIGEHGPTVGTRVVAGRQYEVPGQIRETTQEGPGLSLDQLLPYSPDFRGRKLTNEQRERIARYVDSLFRAPSPDQKVTRAHVISWGKSSDEDATKHNGKGGVNLGKPSTNNETLAVRRGQLVGTYASNYAKQRGYPLTVDSGGAEVILDDGQIAAVQGSATIAHLPVAALLSRHNGGVLHPSATVADTLGDLFDANRGAGLSSTLTLQTTPRIGTCDRVVQQVVVPDMAVRTEKPASNGKVLLPFPGYVPRLRSRRKPGNKDSGEPRKEPQADKEPKVDLKDPEKRNEPKTTGVEKPSGQTVAPGLVVGRGRVRTVPTMRRPGSLDAAPGRGEDSDVLATYLRRGAGALALLALAGWPHFRHETADTPNISAEECTTVVIHPGARLQVGWTFLAEALQARHTGKITPVHEAPFDLEFTRVSTIHAPYQKYVVDTNGNVISVTDMPKVADSPQIVDTTYQQSRK